MHDGGVVVAHLAGVSVPPAVAAAVVCAVGVAAVFAHGQNGSGPDPGILVELGRPGVLVNNIIKYELCVNISAFFLSVGQSPTIQVLGGSIKIRG